ncbi:hypothetical protein SLEP1_g27452 [Rubroshorea leprosula]|uniref:Stress-induced protein KIN2-like n=1 Tax=Rubroshorea leprosula TaxID=152421 RepID=A0AAV5JZR9_9ROSI|nr:hypothetical protein SLEP1_g27452 [Rubroshorea leprosula]
MSSTENASFQAGQAEGKTEEKASSMIDRAKETTQNVKESCQESGQRMMDKAGGAAQAAKDKISGK